MQRLGAAWAAPVPAACPSAAARKGAPKAADARIRAGARAAVALAAARRKRGAVNRRGARPGGAAERLLGAAPGEGHFAIGLCFPNTYRVGMANLGLQVVAGLLAALPGCRCERLFLPADGGGRPRPAVEPRSVESGRPLSRFDLICFSAPFEADYLHIVEMVRAAGLAVRAADRPAWPLLLAGSTGVSLNPEPLAPFFDALFLGEAEAALPEVVARLRALHATTADREVIGRELADLPGLYLPAGYIGETRAGRFAGLTPRPAFPARVARQWLRDLTPYPTHSRYLPADSVFGDMFLLETSRGCPRQCRFCTAGYADNPPRHHPVARLLAEAEAALPFTRRVGLVAPSPGDHPDFLALVEGLVARGATVSPSSIRIDHLTPEVVDVLVRSGNRSLTLAPEGGSEWLRRVVSKGFDEGQILAAADTLANAGIDRVKLYLMVGLPGERDADVEAMAALVAAVRERFLPHWQRAGHAGAITVSLNQLIPKPHTPFQWAPLEPFAQVAAKVATLRGRLARLGNVELDCEGETTVAVEAILARGDRRAADLLEAAAAAGGRWRKVLPAWLAATGIDLHAPLEVGAPLPWDHVEAGVVSPYLAREAHRASLGKASSPCPPGLVGCHKCGVC